MHSTPASSSRTLNEATARCADLATEAAEKYKRTGDARDLNIARLAFERLHALIEIADLFSGRPRGIERACLRDLLLYPELRPRLGELVIYVESTAVAAILAELAASSTPAAVIISRHAGADESLAKLATIEPIADEDKLTGDAERTFAEVLKRLSRHCLYRDELPPAAPSAVARAANGAEAA